MAYELANDPYVDPATGVMRNRHGIRDMATLARIEQNYATLMATRIIQEWRPDHWDAALLCQLHHELFGGIYDWAGSYRTVEISKGTSRFAMATYIPAQTSTLFAHLESEHGHWNRGGQAVLDKLAHYYSELNVIHPFREGNGRTIRLFLALLARHHGWLLQWENASAVENIAVCEQAFYGDEAPLRAMMQRIGRRIGAD